MSETPEAPPVVKKRTHPWRAWQPGALASKDPTRVNPHKFPKGLSKANRAR